MPFVKAGSLQALAPGRVAEVEHNGTPYAVANIDGQIICLEGLCPHAGGPLGQGTLQGNMLVCPWHGWEFDCQTGANDFDPALKLQLFPVHVDNGQITIDVP